MTRPTTETFDEWRNRVRGETEQDTEHFAAVFGRSRVPSALTATGPPGVMVVAANDAAADLLRRPDLAGADIATIMDPTDLPPDLDVIERIRTNQVDVLFRRRRYLRGDGTTVTVNATSVVTDVRDGYALHVAAFVEPARTEWIQARSRRDDELNAALAELRAALLRGDSTDAVFGLICDCTRDLLGADSSGLLELEGSERIRVRATDSGRPPEQDFSNRKWQLVDDDFGAALASGRTTRYHATKARVVGAGGHVDPTVADDAEIHIAVAPVEAAGTRFGALVIRRACIPFSDADVDALEAFAAGVSDALTVAEARADLERLRVLEVRQQIARNLHDEVIQDLIAVRLGLVALAPDAENAKIAARVATLRDELDAATKRLRDVVAGLEAPVGPAEFGDTLRSLTRSRALRHGIGWTVDLHGPLDEIGDDERAEVLRVLNEAISNVVRHAGASRVDLVLVVDDDRVCVVVEDDGTGPARAAGATGMGLRNLRGRAGDRGGECTIAGRPNGGTRLEWWIPRGPRR